MDLLILVFWICVIGFVVYQLTARIKMPDGWPTAIRWLAAGVIAFYLFDRFVGRVPNVLPGG
jgi:hypothetical protein